MPEPAPPDATTPEAAPAVGDLVIVPVPEARARIGCDAEVGLALEDRRHVIKVFFPGMDRVFWLERDALQAVPDGRLPTDDTVSRLHRTAQRVQADQIEFYDGEDDQSLIYVFSRGVHATDVDAVRALWGDALRTLRVVPANMRVLRLELTLARSAT